MFLARPPNSDRVSIAVKDTDREDSLMTENQVSALLMNFVLRYTNLSKYNNLAVVKRVVISELGADMMRKHNITVFSMLTGFKFIGEKITQFERSKQNDNKERDYDSLFGYVGYYDYLAGTHARDKDAVVSSLLLIYEMAAETRAKAKGMALLDEMQEICKEYGYYFDALDSFILKEKDGLEKIFSKMFILPFFGLLFDDTREVINYSNSVEVKCYRHLTYLCLCQLMAFGSQYGHPARSLK